MKSHKEHIDGIYILPGLGLTKPYIYTYMLHLGQAVDKKRIFVMNPQILMFRYSTLVFLF